MINGARFAKSRVCRVRQVRSSGARRPGDATKMLGAGALTARSHPANAAGLFLLGVGTSRFSRQDSNLILM